MSCVIGYAERNKAWIGGDSAWTRGCEVGTGACKVYQITPDLIVGAVGSWRHANLLRYSLGRLLRGSNPLPQEEYVVTVLIPAIRTLYQEGGFTAYDDGQEKGDHFLVGYRGSLFEVDSSFGAMPIEHYIAAGCGAQYAMGAMAILQSVATDPEDRIAQALDAVAAHDAHVRPPHHILSCKG